MWLPPGAVRRSWGYGVHVNDNSFGIVVVFLFLQVLSVFIHRQEV